MRDLTCVLRALGLGGLALTLWACAPAETESWPPIGPLSSAFGLCAPHYSSASAEAVSIRREAGVAWVRRDVSWKSVEPSLGVYDFSKADGVIDRERAGGMEVLVILDYGHPAYSRQTETEGRFPPDDPEDYGAYVAETVAHFQGRVHAWEIWNEPNFPIFWPPIPDAAAYGKLARIGAERIRAVDPSATILLGGMLGNVDPLLYGGGPWAFLEAVLAAEPGLLDHVDVLSLHPYTWGQYVHPEVPSGTVSELQVGFDEMLLDGRRILTEHGHAQMPIWATEYGWHTALDATVGEGVSETMQAALMVRSTVMALARGVERVFVFQYADGEVDMSDKEHHFGLVHHDADTTDEAPAARKPAYDAYRTMVAQLAPAAFDQDLAVTWKLPEGVYAYAFARASDGARVMVAWSVSDEPQSIDLPSLPLGTVGMDGSTVEDEGLVVSLSAVPVYVTMAAEP